MRWLTLRADAKGRTVQETAAEIIETHARPSVAERLAMADRIRAQQPQIIDFDVVAGFDLGRFAGGPRVNDVAGEQRHDGADIADDFRDVTDEFGGAAVLHLLAVDAGEWLLCLRRQQVPVVPQNPPVLSVPVQPWP